MRALFLVTILFSLSISASTVMCTDPDNPSELQMQITRIGDVLKEISPFEQPGHHFYDCSPNEIVNYRSAFRAASRSNQQIINQIDVAIRTYPEMRVRLLGAKRTLECIQRKIPNITVQCIVSDENFVNARTLLNSRRIYLNTLNLTRNSAIETNRGSRVGFIGFVGGTITHEAAHKCGATDAAYFRRDAPRDIRLTQWSRIADTYKHWNVWGFCVPGRTCRNR